jgi:hypothetical protein
MHWNVSTRTAIYVSRVHVTCVTMEKQCVAYSECVFVTLIIQNVKRVRCIILSYVACLAVAPLCILSKKKARFGGGMLEGDRYEP